MNKLERSKFLLAIVVGIAAIFIVWKVGFQASLDELVGSGGDPNVVSDANRPSDANEAELVGDANDPNAPADPNRPAEPNGPADANAPAEPNGVSDPNKPGEPNEPMESINLNNVEMKNIIQKIAEWTGKTVIPHDDAQALKLTIYAPKRLPRSKALAQIYSALFMKGFVAEYLDDNDTIFLKPIGDKGGGHVPTVKADEPLATFVNKDQIVQKFFQLKNYSPQQMAQVVQPLMGDYGYVSADENARTLLMIDTVGNLIRIERIIEQFDIPEAEQMVTRVFDIKYGDPSEIVQILQMLLGEDSTGSSSRNSNNRNNRNYQRFGPRPQPTPVKKTTSQGSAMSITVGTTRGPVVLIPEPRRKWIIARGSAEDMLRIEEWIKKLDREEPVESEYEIVQLRYASPGEVEDSVGDGFRDMPGISLLPSVLIEPLEQTKQVIVFGNKELREIVKKMISEIDVPPGMFETRHFPLKNADPETIKTNLEELFGDSSTTSSNRGYNSYNYNRGRSSSTSSADTVKVIAYTTRQEVTVIASAEKMVEIAAQIEQWDQPLDLEKLKPRIIELRNSDPVQLAELLNTLFSDDNASTNSRNIISMIFGGSTSSASKIVGPLYGQLTFQDIPGTKKIIVISKIPEAYDVIEQLVKDLDSEEMAEVPKVITLKYANPEDLCERLNAMFAEPGTQAPVQRTIQGLSDYSMADASSTTGTTTTNQDTYTPPWSGAGARGRVDQEMPISNVIGKIRFVPEPHMKALLVLSPPEFMDEIELLIEALDQPGKQVMLQAIVMEIDHQKVTSLGVQLATNPNAFGSLEENAITALSNLTSVGFNGDPATGGVASTGAVSGGNYSSGTVVDTSSSVYALIDFLVKNTNAKILNQQTLWTKDNEEAMFFKGQQVAFSTSATNSATAGNTQNFEFQRVGMTLRTRPSITPKKDVDMIVNVIISQLTSDLVNNQPVRTEMDTTTNMIVGTGQTLLLGGMLLQKDSFVQRKLPVLGDVPLLGGLFRHKEKIESNNELLVFITPFVVDDANDVLPEPAIEAQKKLEEFRSKIERTIKKMESTLPGAEKAEKNVEQKGVKEDAEGPGM